MDALILFSHGSLLCGSGEALDSHATRLRARGEWSQVEVGYMNYSEPTFAQAVSRCEARGATRIIVAPFFLVPGFFVMKTLPTHIAQARADFPHVEFLVAGAIGCDEKLTAALIESARDAAGPSQWRDDLTAAARGCGARPDCPLYGTPNCPRVPALPSSARLFVE